MSRHLANALLAVFLLWTMMFSPWTAPQINNFWGAMTASAVLLAAIAFWFGHRDGQTHPLAESLQSCTSVSEHLRNAGMQLTLGLVLAGGLWLVFRLGATLMEWLWPLTRPEMDALYRLREGYSPTLISGLLLLIGAAEELFWRGYIQPTFALYFADGLRIGALELSPRKAAWLVTTLLCTAVCIPSLNPMLIIAALVAGTVWGGIYCFQPKYYPAIVLSHGLWSAAILIWLPL